MAQEYSNPKRANDTYSLPDLEVFELTAREVAEREEDLIIEYSRMFEFRIAGMNSQVRDKMFDRIIEDSGITGAWFYWYCFPGCLPDSEPFGPFKSYNEALADARENAPNEDE
jgi:hypothetical protein